MIRICKPYIEKQNGYTRCNCEIIFGKEKKLLWFEVEEKYSDYLCVERGDAYLIGLLHWAMQHNEDIKCDVPITEELLYNIRTILMPSVANYAKSLNIISIDAEIAPALMKGEYNGTGCSCGIDSFSAIYNHTRGEFPGLDITHVCLNNVGAFNDCYNEYGIEKVKEERFAQTKQVAKFLKLDLIETDSNYQEVIPENHFRTHTYSSMFAVYMLQKFWKTYYYASSGADYSHFNIIDNDEDGCSHYELLSLQCFSIPGLRIYSEGGEKTRFDKTKDIVDFEPARKFLHVCLHKPINCNTCSKCKRTLVTLDILGKLDNFKEVFDIGYYKNNRTMYYKWLYEQHVNKDLLNEPVYQLFRKNKEFRKKILIYKPIIITKRILKTMLIKLHIKR